MPGYSKKSDQRCNCWCHDPPPPAWPDGTEKHESKACGWCDGSGQLLARFVLDENRDAGPPQRERSQQQGRRRR